MDSTDEESTTPKGYLFYNLLIICVLLILTPYFKNSYTEPGGILHGAKVTARPYYHAIFGPRLEDTDPYQDNIPLCHPNDKPLPAIRTTFGDRGTIVYGWPSAGGVWVHDNCYGVELDFLGVSRFEISATERYSQEEDDFCQRLEWIGAKFYANEAAYNNEIFSVVNSKLWVGWPGAVPEGGVWVLATRGIEGSGLGVSRIRNAFTMEERCRAIEILGGKFHKQWEDAAKVMFDDENINDEFSEVRQDPRF